MNGGDRQITYNEEVVLSAPEGTAEIIVSVTLDPADGRVMLYGWTESGALQPVLRGQRRQDQPALCASAGLSGVPVGYPADTGEDTRIPPRAVGPSPLYRAGCGPAPGVGGAARLPMPAR